MYEETGSAANKKARSGNKKSIQALMAQLYADKTSTVNEMKALTIDSRSNSCIEHTSCILEEEKGPENLSKENLYNVIDWKREEGMWMDNGAVPTMTSSWQNVEESECQMAYDLATELYMSSFDRSKDPEEVSLRKCWQNM